MLLSCTVPASRGPIEEFKVPKKARTQTKRMKQCNRCELALSVPRFYGRHCPKIGGCIDIHFNGGECLRKDCGNERSTRGTWCPKRRDPTKHIETARKEVRSKGQRGDREQLRPRCKHPKIERESLPRDCDPSSERARQCMKTVRREREIHRH